MSIEVALFKVYSPLWAFFSSTLHTHFLAGKQQHNEQS